MESPFAQEKIVQQTSNIGSIPEEAPASPKPAGISLASLRLRLLIQAGVYVATFFLFFRAVYALDGMLNINSISMPYAIPLVLLSMPGHIVLIFWPFIYPATYTRRQRLFVPTRLSRQLQGLSLLGFISNLLMFFLFSSADLSDAIHIITMVLGFPVFMVFGGLVWLIFFNKTAGFLEEQTH